ncbi:L-rhamnose mutarotase, partial [Staphylococcus aureus]
GYYEYVGDDLAADDAKMAADPVTQEWWALTGPCQVPFDDVGSEPNWQIMTEAWHLD